MQLQDTTRNPSSHHFFGDCNLDDFQLLHRLGSGAFGRVYLATNQGRNGPMYAVKIIENCNKNEVENALKEVELLYNLSHENIVRPIAWNEKKDSCGLFTTIYLGMEYCNGTFKDRLKEKRKEIKHFEWMLQMSSGLAYLHSKGVIHRDLKPANILVKTSMEGECLKLSDFGLSKVMPPSPKSRIFPVMYGAPEVISGCHYNTMADVFSLGCICYGMLEGCYEVVENEKHFSAFVFLPELGQRISLGKALKENAFLKIGITMTGDADVNTIKELTLNMLQRDPDKRIKAEDVKQRLKELEAKVMSHLVARPSVPVQVQSCQ